MTAKRKTGEKLGALNGNHPADENIAIVLYAGLMKHHKHITLNLTKKIVDDILDEGYGLDSFSDILDEYARCYRETFSASDEMKTKNKFARRDEI